MSRIVVVGGTDGMGRAVALERVGRGDEVVVVGRDPAKGRAFLAAAGALGGAERAHFVAAELSSVAATRAAVGEIRARFDSLDALLLFARHFRSERLVTDEGFEYTFALFYLSRFVLCYGLVDLLDRAERPVIVNVAGPGSGTGAIRWDDLGGARDYDGMRALTQGGQLNDLLGVRFARRRAAAKVRYVLLHPGVVNTALSGDYDERMTAEIEKLRRTAQSVDEAVVPILRVLDDPPAAPLTAIVRGQPLDVHGPAFDTEAADRLHTETVRLLGALQPAAPGVAPDRLRQVLDSPVFATVATVQPDGGPHQSVVWVLRDGDDVLFAVAAGSRKERNLRRDPRVSVLLSPPEAPYTYAAVHGTATLETEGAQDLRDRLALKYTGQKYADHNPEAAALNEHLDMVTVRVTPQRVVGRL
ncbi:TIGR03618 family F420-dependent PPOX class oxidoreductase [Nocardia blacklockiae]|uniref:TIGR03618 family F420-dependent PPOX class oxidoreductase n=1 Tax=Nocardia blacklockiae TaxID=480036 RepID=UPI0018940616|nr:TIGR03618 family F420-dependent PPOX class oxidoreductase [Nocardia blacklockiae]MBF6171875.1 TIGR03618 family F420-dependent PPOX class oxidoreductase [Nocardia blacklockiae]